MGTARRDARAAGAPVPGGEGVDAAAAELYGLLVAVLRGVPRDLSLTALSTLANLERTGPRRLTELAAAEGVAQPSMSTLVDNLERAGHVERRPDPHDGRATLVRITSRGTRLLARRRQAGARAMAELIERLDPDDRRSLVGARAALARLRALDEQRHNTPRPPP